MRMRTKRKKDWSREPYPVGTIRVRPKYGKKKPARVIKVSNTALPRQRCWKLYARWLWEQKRGPVPEGYRVGHLDGDTLNDSLDNLALLTPGDINYLAHERDPEMSRKNRETIRRVTAERNRLQSRIFRALNFVKSRWYPVDCQSRVIINRPFKKRKHLLIAYGVDVSRLEKNGRGPYTRAAIDASPVLPVKSEELSVTPYCRFEKIDAERNVISQ